MVILAGGLGTRMREETEFRPKPMVEVGGKPILWHIMKGFAAFGHTDFIICAGYKAEMIRDYFYNYAARNLDFTVKLGDSTQAVFHGSHEEFGWNVTVVDTGHTTPTGGRIRQIEPYVKGERFLCTYGDGLAPVDLRALVKAHNRVATMTVTRPVSRFGVVEIDDNLRVEAFREKPSVDSFVNMGFFVFEPEVFRYLDDKSALEEEPLRKIASEKELDVHIHTDFWQPMDTYRESLLLNRLWESESAPWKTW